MTDADAQLVTWYLSTPGRSTSFDLAIGYLLSDKQVTAKLKRECEATLESMRTERMRDLGRSAA